VRSWKKRQGAVALDEDAVVDEVIDGLQQRRGSHLEHGGDGFERKPPTERSGDESDLAGTLGGPF
jgi:hypothetical protein